MTLIVVTLALTTLVISFLVYAHKRKWFFLSVVDEERYEREKPLFK